MISRCFRKRLIIGTLCLVLGALFTGLSFYHAGIPGWITTLAKLSFGMYLIHLFFLSNIAPVFVAGDQANPLIPVYLAIPCIAILTFVCSAVTSWLISKLPISKWIIGA